MLQLRRTDKLVIFWDVDAPATLTSVQANPTDLFRGCVPHYDLILTYGGGDPVVTAYMALGAQQCIPIYNAFDPDTHHPVQPDGHFEGLMGFMGNRLPDRETRVDEFFFKAAHHLPDQRFILGGNGWGNKAMPLNVEYVGHIYTHEHNAFNASPLTVLNINRQSMSDYGFSPPTRVFEAAGAGACLITDAWAGIEQFLQPNIEVLVAENGQQVADYLTQLTAEKAYAIGQASRARVLREHTYQQRAQLLEEILSRQLQGNMP